MAGESDVIRQFMVSLGFQVDQNGLKKFVQGLATTEKGALGAGSAVLGIAVAAEAMVIQFSSSMEKLYYASRRTGASVENIKGLEFGAQQVGIAAGTALQALENMGAAVRMNPGIRALMDGLLGKDTAGLDPSQVMLELVQKLATMPHYQGAQFASMFGMDEQTFLMMKAGLPEIIRDREKLRALYASLGIDQQAAAEAGTNYANSVREIGMHVGALRDKLAIELMPAFKGFNDTVIEALDNVAKFKLADHPNLERAAKDAPGYLPGPIGAIVSAGKVLANPRAAWSALKSAPRDAFHAINDWRDSYRPGGSRSDNGGRGTMSGAGASPDPANFGASPDPANFGALESQYNLPPGLLDRIYAKESNRGKNLLGPVTRNGQRAEGPFQFMPATSKEYGINPYDLAESSRAAARKMAGLLKHYGGDLYKAAAAYNWGEGNLDKYGIDGMPRETRDYAAAIANGAPGKNVTISQKTDIHVNGTDSPKETARQVAMVQDDTNGNTVRNMVGAIQ
jgi:hypothetical protein